MEQSHAVRLPSEPAKEASLAAPLATTPAAAPQFRHAMTWFVLLSIPLWALIIGGGYLAFQAFN
ncbi:MAG TPA: hypothetical protein PLQ19_05890 [Aeromicrobium sp.]|nr:hypothetical protein [Aeromicrobium sp.]